jgi:hypothetical protein
VSQNPLSTLQLLLELQHFEQFHFHHAGVVLEQGMSQNPLSTL